MNAEVRGTSWALSAQPQNVRAGRDRVLAQIRRWGHYVSEDTADTVRLLVSEILTNAVEHGGGDTVQISMAVRPGELYVRIEDASSTAPVRRSAAEDAEDGRGLFLLSTLANAWGAEPSKGGKAVWMPRSLPPRRPLLIDERHRTALDERIRAARPRPRLPISA